MFGFSKPSVPDTHPREETICPSNIGSGIKPESLQDPPDPGLLTSEILQTPDPIVGQGSDFSPPTHDKQYSPSNIPQELQVLQTYVT